MGYTTMPLRRTHVTRFNANAKPRNRVAQFVLAGLFCVVLSASYDATATTEESWPEYKIALYTDAWVRARVLETRDAENHQCAITLEVQASTDPHLPKIITLVTVRHDEFWEVGDQLYQIALRRDGDVFATLRMVRNAYYKIQRESVVGNHTAEDLGWEWFCDMRLLVDQDGVAPDALRDKWLDRIRWGSPEEARLAIEWLEQLKEPNIDPMVLATSVLEHFEQLPNQVRGGRQGSYFRSLYVPAASTIARLGDTESAEIMARIYWEDKTSLRILRGSQVERVIVKVLLVPPSEDNVNYLESLLGSSFDADAYIISSFVHTPGEPMRELLWRIIEAPQAYGIRTIRPLEEVWRGLASQNDPDLRAYLKTHVLEPDVPNLGIKIADKTADKTKALKKKAREYYHAIPPSEKERVEDVRELAEQIVAGNLDLCQYLRRLLRPEDRKLSEILAHAQIEGAYYRTYFLQHIVEKIPDPAFVPLLKSWSKKEIDSWVVKALIDCGEESEAFKLAVAHLQEPLQTEEIGTLHRGLWERVALIQALLETRYKTQVLEWVRACFSEQEAEEPWMKSLREVLQTDDQWIRPMRFSILLAYAKGDRKRALPALRNAFKNEKELRMNVAMCLYYLGDNRGIEYVDAFRLHREELPYVQLKRFYSTIRYLEDPALDALALERLQHGFDFI
jgi:hypothetical protein